MNHRRELFVLAIAWLCVGAGCRAVEKATPQRPEPRTVAVYRGEGGAIAPWAEVVSAAAGADVVVIGENHGHALGLAVAAALWADVVGSPGTNAALSMEFFERDEQANVDDYLSGITDEGTFKKRSRRTASNYPSGHREMVELAREKGRPVIAANAPGPYVRAARTKGYEALAVLSPEQKRLFRVPDELPTGKYRDDFDAIMGDMNGTRGHDAAGKGSGKAPSKSGEEIAAEEAEWKERLDASFRSQSVWDWTMAESITRGLDGGFVPVVQVVGRFHGDHRGGLVQAVEKIRPGTRIVIVSFVDEASQTLREEDRGRGDFVVYVGPFAEK